MFLRPFLFDVTRSMRAAPCTSSALTARAVGYFSRGASVRSLSASAKPVMPRPRQGSARASLEPSVADGVVLSITSVIKYGAPLYNKGDAKECSKLYKQTALSIARDTAVTSEAIKKRLRDAVAESDAIFDTSSNENESNENDNVQRMHEKSAWALRRGLDDVVDLLLNPSVDEPRVFEAMKKSGGDGNDESNEETPTGSSAPIVATPTAALFDFQKSPKTAEQFREMHDRVMGGVSVGSMKPSTNAKGEVYARFSGVVRPDNNGGFASTRISLGSGVDLSQFDGFYLDVRAGDEKTAQKQILLVAKDDECMNTQVNFKAAFKVGFEGDSESSSSWSRVLIPFAAFDRPERMGRAVVRGPLKSGSICEIGLMVLKEMGDFDLEIRAIGMYK